MKITVERDQLAEALGPVSRLAKQRSTIPILNHILLTAAGTELQLCGHNLDQCATARVAAAVAAAGAVAVPGDELAKLTGKMPEGSQVTIELVDDGRAIVLRFARSRYKLPALPAADFPAVLTPQNPIVFEIDAEDVATLLKPTRHFVEPPKGRLPLTGVQLRGDGKQRLVAEASNGVQLIRRSVALKAAGKLKGMIVPPQAVDEIIALAENGATLSCAANLISVATSRVTFTSKLIDAQFPDLDRAVPKLDGTGFLGCDREELLLAIDRLSILGDGGAVVIGWQPGEESFTAQLRAGAFEGGEGAEPVACEIVDLKEAGSFAVVPRQLRELLNAMPGEIVRLHYSEPGAPIRLVAPAHDDLVAVVMPRRA